jgi:hypothetical protein
MQLYGTHLARRSMVWTSWGSPPPATARVFKAKKYESYRRTQAVTGEPINAEPPQERF